MFTIDQSRLHRLLGEGVAARQQAVVADDAFRSARHALREATERHSDLDPAEIDLALAPCREMFAAAQAEADRLGKISREKQAIARAVRDYAADHGINLPRD